MALTAEDLKVGVDEAFGQFLNMPRRHDPRSSPPTSRAGRASSRGSVPSVRTSGRPGQGRASPPWSTPRPLDEADRPRQGRPAPPSSAPDESLPAVLADLEKDTDVQVLMVQGPPELAKTLAEKYPAFDVVVAHLAVRRPARARRRAAQRRQDPAGARRPARASTSASSASSRRRRAAAVPLPARDPRQPRTTARRTPMKKLIEDEYREHAQGQPGSSRTSPATTTSTAPRARRSSAPRRASRATRTRS